MRRAARRIGAALAALLYLLPPALAASAEAPPAAAHLTLHLNAPRSARFAGYYVALALGYYAAAGLDVTIRAAQSASEAPLGRVANQANDDVWSATLPQVLRANAQGDVLVNFAQILPHSGLELVCRKASGIHAPIDFAGHDIGVWRDGAAPILAWLARMHLDTPGAIHVHFLPYVQGEAAASPLLNRDVSCIEAQSFDQYFDIVDAGISANDLQVFHVADAGTATLPDGVYATAASIANAKRASDLARFLRASIQGWQFAVTHQPEAVGLVLQDRPPQPEERQRELRAMAAVAPLTASGLQKPGFLEPAAYDRTVQIMMQTGALRTAPPAGGWTHAIWTAATK